MFLKEAEVVRIAQVVAGAEVSILVNEGGRVAWVDMDEFWRQLGVDEQLVSVEPRQYGGKRDKMFSIGLPGGLF